MAKDVATMTEHAKDAEAIFLAALDKASPRERAAYVEGAGARDPALLRRVRELLDAYEESQGPLDVPPPGLVGTVDLPRLHEGPGTVIGPYKLLQQIGGGGMGAVFMAEQSRPVQRKVALKIIKPGMDSAQVIARFEQERQALALMDHPHIAKVLDAGTTDSGRPYFVMELVKGMPITKYCDDRHLTPTERLELFLPVCQAVQHAHQKGIIHRDLKPSNVLVALYDGKPVPKIIDFGVAKATGPRLTERTLFTEFGQVIGTLEYMSPEQAELNQLDIDTRSDIYALGVLLYELLTGTTPLQRERVKESSLLELLRCIREEEPPKPSTRLGTTEALPVIAANRGLEPRKLAGLVRGELDWIVMKALDKDRSQRYETANALARDVQRYLADEPVLACPPSALYRCRKFARRHKAPLATAVLLVVGLAGSTALVWRERQEAIRQRDEAREQRQRAEDNLREACRAVDDSFTLVSENVLLKEPALEPLRKELLQTALRYYEDFVRTHGDDPELQGELVAAHLRITNLVYALGAEEDWLTPLQRAVDVMEELLPRKPDVSKLRSLQRGVFRPLAAGLRTPQPVEGLRTCEKACTLWEELVRAHPAVPGFRNDLAVFCLIRGICQERTRQYAEAVNCYRRTCDLLQGLVAENPTVPHYRATLVLSLGVLAADLTFTGQMPPGLDADRLAAEVDRQALEMGNQLVADFPGVAAYEGLRAWLCNVLGQGRERRARFREAEEAYRQAKAGYEKLARAYPTVPRHQLALILTLHALGDLLWATGRTAEAADVYRQCFRSVNGVILEDPGGQQVLAWFLAACPDPAFRDAGRAVALAKQAVEGYPHEGFYWVTLGAAEYRTGNWNAAIHALQKALELDQRDSSAEFLLAMACWQRADHAEARRWYDRAVESMNQFDPRDPDVRRLRAEAEALLQQKKD